LEQGDLEDDDILKLWKKPRRKKTRWFWGCQIVFRAIVWLSINLPNTPPKPWWTSSKGVCEATRWSCHTSPKPSIINGLVASSCWHMGTNTWQRTLSFWDDECRGQSSQRNRNIGLVSSG
jgi:hypothetical protein